MKKISFILIICFSLLLTGCIDIIEKVHINKDGSGTFEMYLDVGDLLSMAQQLDGELFEDFNRDDNSISEISNIKGISNVSMTPKKKSDLMYLKFDFENSNALNNALYAYFMDDEPTIKPNIISVNKNRIKQKNITPFVVKQMEDQLDNEQLNKIMQYVNCKVIVTTENDIKKVKGDKVKKVENNTAELNVSLDDIMEYEPDLSFKVKY